MKITRINRKFNPENPDTDYRRYISGPIYQHGKTTGLSYGESKAMTFYVMNAFELNYFHDKVIELWDLMNADDSNWTTHVGEDDEVEYKNWSLGMQYLQRATFYGVRRSSEYLDLSFHVVETYIEPILQRIYDNESLTFTEWLGFEIDEEVIPDATFYLFKTLKEGVTNGRFPISKIDFDHVSNLTHDKAVNILKGLL